LDPLFLSLEDRRTAAPLLPAPRHLMRHTGCRARCYRGCTKLEPNKIISKQLTLPRSIASLSHVDTEPTPHQEPRETTMSQAIAFERKNRRAQPEVVFPKGLHFLPRLAVLVIALVALTEVASADDRQSHNYAIQAQALGPALKAFALQADREIFFTPELTRGKQSHGISGKYDDLVALKVILEGTGLTYSITASKAIIVRDPPSPLTSTVGREGTSDRPDLEHAPGFLRVAQSQSQTSTPPSATETESLDQNADEKKSVTLDEIMVTARKRSESLLDVPVSVTAFSSQTIQDFKIQSFSDYANKIPNLSYGYGDSGTFGMAGSRAVALRGIVGANTTGFYIDDTPVYDSMDPRIVDVERIEVLRGPQGTLFGSRSLGGNVRIITKHPNVDQDEFSYAAQISDTDHGGGDYEVESIGNLVVIPERVAVRAMGFYSSDSGFLTRTYPVAGSATLGSDDNQGAAKTGGASLAVLFKVTDDLDITFRELYQREELNGWPVAYAPLPAFQVTSLTLNRQVNVQELGDNQFSIPSLEIAYRGRGWSLASSTSFSDYKTYDVEDGTEGMGQFYLANFGLSLPPTVPIAVSYTNTKQRLTQETRILFDPRHGISGVAGIYFSNEHTHLSQPPYYASGQAAAGLWPNDVIYASDIHNGLQERAVFGELYANFLEKFTLTLGARAFWLKETDNQVNAGLFAGTYPVQLFDPLASTEHGVIPKISLQYEPTHDSSIYASAAKGYRPGGIIPYLLPNLCEGDLVRLGLPSDYTSYKSDSIWSYELGGKMALADRRLLLTADVFQINWSNIQQSLYLACTASTIINIGAARNRGAELELSGHVFEPLELRAALGINDAKITDSFPGSPLPAGSRILEVPKVTASVGARFEHPITDSIKGFVGSDYSYTGNSASENTSVAFPVTRSGYSMVNARLGISWNKSELSLFGNNLTNTRANLGDPLLYTFRKDITLPNGQTVLDPRVVVARPLQIGIRFQQAF
jgi:iron complex outermembrane recepter protein